ncbi:GAF and ANTAR domain-containing protein [Nonomuraea sp. NPDC046570]|uniref:GAF and ANTAR domain-containing protein n=1 Tax=Nonomuraea sp. NPDC046570 TaxID=3155255 RepID=UPI0033CDAE6B
MDSRRPAARVWAAIDDRSRAEGEPISLRLVCAVCADVLRADGVAVALTSERVAYEPVGASDARIGILSELQVTLGEGPGLQALADGRPVLVPDLAAADTQRRWPLFAPAAVDAGAAAIFAFPLLLGAISVGVLEAGRETPGWLTDRELGDALVFTDAALLVQVQGLDERGGRGGEVERWAEVHQATGIVAVQTGTNLTEALLRLRAHAYASDRRLIEVASDVVARRLRFH